MSTGYLYVSFLSLIHIYKYPILRFCGGTFTFCPEWKTTVSFIRIVPSSGVSIPAILFSVRLFPQPDAPRIPIRDAPLRNRTSNRKSPSTFFISTDNPIFFYHLFTFFIFLPDSRFIKTIITNAIKITTATQIPAVR